MTDRAGVLAERARVLLRSRTHDEPRVAYAPGRVNLIGEHTDYNDGFVLPMAIDRGVAVAYLPRRDNQLVAYSAMVGAEERASLAALDGVDRTSWFAYVAGVAWAFGDRLSSVTGAALVIDADLTAGAGLSSSAALEVAVARALTDLAGDVWNPADAARLAQRAENEFVGVACGIMDQLTSAAGEPGHALLIDCRSLAVEPVPLPRDVAVVVMDTGVRRRLATSAYVERRAACARAVEVIRERHPGVRALRDVTAEQLSDATAVLGDTMFRRAKHVVEENARVLAAAAAFRRNDLASVGRLVNQSHESLRDLYEVSGPELDLIVSLAQAHPACVGARMTGAGFGGCAVALVQAAGVDEFTNRVWNEYAARGHRGQLFVVQPSAGAHLTGEGVSSGADVSRRA